MTKIPSELYKQIMENVPICCIDFVVLHQGKVLLTFRNDEPAKGKWWIQGGRLLKNERIEDAVRRKAREEIGVDVKLVRRTGTYEYFCRRGHFPDFATGVHDIAICYLVEPASTNFNLDSAHSQYRWIDHIEKDLDPYVQNVLGDARVFGKNES